MKFYASHNLQGVQDPKDFKVEVTQSITNLALALNKNLNFTDNIQGQLVLGVTVQGYNTRIPHSLGKVPIGFLLLKTNSADPIYAGSVAWSKEAIFLSNNQITFPSQVNLFIVGG